MLRNYLHIQRATARFAAKCAIKGRAALPTYSQGSSDLNAELAMKHCLPANAVGPRYNEKVRRTDDFAAYHRDECEAW
jgi:hypothetical protein